MYMYRREIHEGATQAMPRNLHLLLLRGKGSGMERKGKINLTNPLIGRYAKNEE